jgi:hypothetical protein
MSLVVEIFSEDIFGEEQQEKKNARKKSGYKKSCWNAIEPYIYLFDCMHTEFMPKINEV